MFLLVTLFGLFLSCKPEPEAIGFGVEECSFCKMTIVDRQHAAQMVSKKGKQFKFDAIECMLNDLSKKENIGDYGIFLVSDYGNSTMTSAASATFLISKEIKSPMGAFLSAFASKVKAEETLNNYGGQLYTWEEIKSKYEIE